MEIGRNVPRAARKAVVDDALEAGGDGEGRGGGGAERDRGNGDAARIAPGKIPHHAQIADRARRIVAWFQIGGLRGGRGRGCGH